MLDHQVNPENTTLNYLKRIDSNIVNDMIKTVGIVNAQIGSVSAVANMVEAAGGRAQVISTPEDLGQASHLILPGVGNFSSATSKLSSGGWYEALYSFRNSGKPLLGICLGMQLLGLGSEEGPGKGLAFLDFVSKSLDPLGERRVPNIGWATVKETADHPIFDGWEEEARFYFVHSFAVPADTSESVGQTAHNKFFSSVIAHENLVGVQFHPEKSHRFGKKLFENFLNFD